MGSAADKYHAAWKVETNILQEARHRKRRGIPKEIHNTSSLTPTEWLNQKLALGEAFFCERRLATITRTTCSSIRQKALNKHRIGVYDGGDDELYVSKSICYGCKQYEEV